MKDRVPLPEAVHNIRLLASGHRKRILFFCSSAGEFEQALPLINRLENGGRFTHTCFFSRSGYDFAQACDFPYSFSLAPYDLPWFWKTIFSSVSPDAAVVIRYELWPGFLYVAAKECPLYLINASNSGSYRRLNHAVVWLLKYFKIIFFSSADQLERQLAHLTNLTTMVVGDTKYDRVLERAKINKSMTLELQEKMAATFGSRKVFIIGSCWEADLIVFLRAWKNLDPAPKANLAIVIAPHDISDENVSHMQEHLRGAGLEVMRFSRWMNDTTLAHSETCLLLDTMGKLAELYGAANCAMIGGANHHKVHNVLEPASHGLAICFGPRYHSQREAILLVKKKLATVIQDSADLERWLQLQSTGHDQTGKAVLAQVVSLAGATEKIISQIPELQD